MAANTNAIAYMLVGKYTSTSLRSNTQVSSLVSKLLWSKAVYAYRERYNIHVGGFISHECDTHQTIRSRQMWRTTTLPTLTYTTNRQRSISGMHPGNASMILAITRYTVHIRRTVPTAVPGPGETPVR